MSGYELTIGSNLNRAQQTARSQIKVALHCCHPRLCSATVLHARRRARACYVIQRPTDAASHLWRAYSAIDDGNDRYRITRSSLRTPPCAHAYPATGRVSNPVLWKGWYRGDLFVEGAYTVEHGHEALFSWMTRDMVENMYVNGWYFTDTSRDLELFTEMQRSRLESIKEQHNEDD